jgi:hypothetical protein
MGQVLCAGNQVKNKETMTTRMMMSNNDRDNCATGISDYINFSYYFIVNAPEYTHSLVLVFQTRRTLF